MNNIAIIIFDDNLNDDFDDDLDDEDPDLEDADDDPHQGGSTTENRAGDF